MINTIKSFRNVTEDYSLRDIPIVGLVQTMTDTKQ